jgi:catechol 2,3-dioxygenase-like lactoylglutathione lyase family enzyme
VADLQRSERFDRAALSALDLLLTRGEGVGHFDADELDVDLAQGRVSHVHLAFQAHSRVQAHAFHAAAAHAGGTDQGPPGPRSYQPACFAAFVLDPDGNNIEVVCHGATRRSAESVVIERLTAPNAEG